MTSMLTRRRLAAAIAVASTARLPAQAPSPDEDLKQAREQVRRNADQLARRPVAMTTEPAFLFKA